MALRRYHDLERKLQRNPTLGDQYREFMDEYIKLGHMSPTDQTYDLEYFMPHHGVLKPTSSTTKLRVVFDASAKTTSGLSLNNTLKVGPTIQNPLFDILVRFRKHRFAFTSDINKMYRQVLVDPQQHGLQQILWRDSSDKPITAYSLKTVTYGTASAPYLATKALQQLAHDERKTYPLAAQVAANDFYVDDVLSGADTIQDALDLQSQLREMLLLGGFHLHKWCANNENLLEAIEPSEREKRVIVGESESVKTLGLIWQPDSDSFAFSIERTLLQDRPNTKRSIMSDIARLYDPLGMLGPIVLKAKLIIQRLWQGNLEWDQPIDEVSEELWTRYRLELKQMADVIIPRCIVPNKPCQSIILMGFCDASQDAYGACLYLHCIDVDGNKMTTLICSKSKVAPLKTLTIPRLELCGAVLLSQLYQKAKTAIQIPIDQTILWSDSTIVLGWLKSNPSNAKTFVSHRIAEIQENTNISDWRHIPTDDNPADMLSRGLMPNEISKSSLWWHGPRFLQSHARNWPNPICTNPDDLPEMKASTSLVQTQPKDEGIFDQFSNYCDMRRQIAYLLRFINNLRNSKNHQTIMSLTTDELSDSDPLTTDELLNSETRIFFMIQTTGFQREQQCLSSNLPLPKKSSLNGLNVFIDDKNLIRVGGRIKNSSHAYDVKHQIVLPQHHSVVKLIIKSLHEEHGHAGQRTLLSIVRQRFWPIRAKNIIRQVVKRCLICFKCQPQTSIQFMGDLPQYRIAAVHPFFNTGVDYAGPLTLRLNRNTTTKAYIAIFVCMSVKAVHIELVSDLSSQAFIAALTRFISRRGHCSNLYSDNGTNFVGTKSILEPLFDLLKHDGIQQTIQKHCSAQSIKFHFVPPRAPHFGGLWEATVKQTKYHLVRIVGNNILNFEEMSTVLTKVEAILNSRPLFAESDDPEDYNAITAGHFIIGRPLVALAEPDYLDVQVNRLKRWELLKKLTQHFWDRFSNEYIATLQRRPGGFNVTTFQVGSLVLIKSEHLPPTRWMLGRIIQLHPGNDGITRVVSIKTQHGIIKRPIVKICVLPNQDD